MKPLGDQPSPSIALEPFQVTRRDLNHLFASPSLVKDLIAAGWIKTVRQGSPGRESLYDFQTAKAAFVRLQNGEEPSL